MTVELMSPGIWWLAFVCLLTLFGNVLVVMAVFRETSLHSATYYYVVSLAVADLCVGVVVIPLAILFELVSPVPSRFLCYLWHVADIGASTASILALCTIALDRYIAITSPIRYPGSFIARHWPRVIAAIWFCSALIACPTVIVLSGRTTTLTVSNVSMSTGSKMERCEFPSDPLYIIVSSLFSFYVPLIIMVFVYGRILIAARRQMAAFRVGYKRTTSGEASQPSPLVPRFRLRTRTTRSPSSSTSTSTTIANIAVVPSSPETITLRIHRGKYSRSPSLAPPPASRTTNGSSFPVLFAGRLRKLRRSRTWSRFSREHKAAKVLGIVMGVFIACWLPFFVFLVLTGVFHVQLGNAQERLFRLFTWLGYTNSALNFLVYVLTSREFRLAFIKLVCPRNRTKRTLIQHNHQQHIHRL